VGQARDTITRAAPYGRGRYLVWLSLPPPLVVSTA